MPENGRRKNCRTITARPGFQKARPCILPMQGYLRLLPITETFSPATSMPSFPVYPARTTPGARYRPAAGFRRPEAYRRGDGSCPRDGGVCGHASHDCLRRARRRGRYRQVPPEGLRSRDFRQPPYPVPGRCGVRALRVRPCLRVRRPRLPPFEPPRPRPPPRPPRPRPLLTAGLYTGPAPTLAGNSALRISLSMNFSIAWNLPCSSSLTNVTALPVAAARAVRPMRWI